MSAAKRWTNIDGNGNLETDMNQLAQMNENTTMWSPYMSKFVFSDWAVEDGSYLRLSTLTLGYTLPVHLTKKVGINNLRFYVTDTICSVSRDIAVTIRKFLLAAEMAAN